MFAAQDFSRYNGRIPTCEKCDLSFPSLPTLDVHIKESHTDGHTGRQPQSIMLNPLNPNLNSRSALYSDRIPTNLLSYQKAVNMEQIDFADKYQKNSEGRYQCPDCEVTTKSEYSLKVHMNLHQGTFRCDICGQNYSAQWSLDQHEKTPNHLKKASMTASVSYLSYQLPLTEGLTSDVDTLRIKCPDCDKTFSTKDTLKVHENMHTDKFRCDICQLNFSKQYFLDKHKISISHNKKLSEQENVLVESNSMMNLPNIQHSYPTVHSFVNQPSHLSHTAEDQHIVSYQPTTTTYARNQNNPGKVSSLDFGQISVTQPTLSLFDKIQQFQKESNPIPTQPIQKQANINKHGNSFQTPVQSIYTKPHVGKRDQVAEKKSEYECNLCVRKFASIDSLRKHKDIHTDRFQCPTCKLGFSLQRDLDNHAGDESKCENLLAKRRSEAKEYVDIVQSALNIAIGGDSFVTNEPVVEQNIPKDLLKNPELTIQLKPTVGSELKEFKDEDRLLITERSQQQSERVKFPTSFNEGHLKESSLDVQNQLFEQQAEQNRRNQKFEKYMMQLQKSNQYQDSIPKVDFVDVKKKGLHFKIKKKRLQKTRSGISKPPRSTVVRTPFRSGKKNYEKYWCITCRLWLSGGKPSVSNHLKNIHEDEDCQIVMITNSGMIKVDKEDFLPAGKDQQITESLDLDDQSPMKVAILPPSREVEMLSRSVSPRLEDSGIDLESSYNSSVNFNESLSLDDSTFSEDQTFFIKGENEESVIIVEASNASYSLDKEIDLIIKEEMDNVREKTLKEELKAHDKAIVLRNENQILVNEPEIDCNVKEETKEESYHETDEKETNVTGKKKEVTVEVVFAENYEELSVKNDIPVNVVIYPEEFSSSTVESGDIHSVSFSYVYHDMIPEQKQEFFQEQLEIDLATEAMPELAHSPHCHCVQCKPCLNVCCENPPVRAGLCCDPSTLGSCLQPFSPRCFAPCCHHSVSIGGEYLEGKEPNASLVNPFQFMLTDEEKVFDGLARSVLNEEEDSCKDNDEEDADSGNGDFDTYLFPFDAPTEGSEAKLIINSDESDEEKEDKSLLKKMNEDYRDLDVYMKEFETHPLDDEMKKVRRFVLEGSKTFPNPHLLVGKDCLQCFEEEGGKTWYKVRILSVVMDNGLDTLFSVQYEDGDDVDNYRLFYNLLADFLKVPGWNAPIQLQPKPSNRSDYSSESDDLEDEEGSVLSDDEEYNETPIESTVEQVNSSIREEAEIDNVLDPQVPTQKVEEGNKNIIAEESSCNNPEVIGNASDNERFVDREIGIKIVDYSISDEDGKESDLDEESSKKSEEGEDNVSKGTEQSSLIGSGVFDDGNRETESLFGGKASGEAVYECIKPVHKKQDEDEAADDKILSSSLVENDELEAAFLDIDYEEESEDEDSKDAVGTVPADVLAEPAEENVKKIVKAVEWTPDPTLPTGWSYKECPRANISRNKNKDVFYLAPGGKKFRSRKQVIDHLNKNGATTMELEAASKGYLKGWKRNRVALQKVEVKNENQTEEDTFCWGFESFKHELCEHQMFDLGESPADGDDEDVYFVLHGKESILLVTDKQENISVGVKTESKSEPVIKLEVVGAVESLSKEVTKVGPETCVAEIKVELEELEEIKTEEKVGIQAHESQNFPLKQEADSDKELASCEAASSPRDSADEISDSEKLFIKSEISKTGKEEPNILMKVEPVRVSKISHLNKKKISVVKLGKQLIKQIDKILNINRNFKRKPLSDLNEKPLKKLKLAKEKPSFSCPDCGINFPTSGLMVEHVGKNHIWDILLNKVTDKPPYICPLSSLGQCSYLQRNRKQITEHIIRKGDQVHNEIIINVVKQKYPNFSVGNQWKVSLVNKSSGMEAGSELESGARRGKVPRKNIGKLHRLNSLDEKCSESQLRSDIFQKGRFSAEPTELILDEGFESGDEVAENTFRISNKFKLKKKKVSPPTPAQLKRLKTLLRLKETYSMKVKQVQELRKKKFQS